MKKTIEQKANALAAFLGVDPIMIDGTDGENFSLRKAEFLVLTGEEANEKASEYIRASLFSFRTEFIASHTKNGLSEAAIEALNEVQINYGENANPLIEALIEDLDHFVKDAIMCDGVAHFLASYDHEENTKDGFLIFRTN